MCARSKTCIIIGWRAYFQKLAITICSRILTYTLPTEQNKGRSFEKH